MLSLRVKDIRVVNKYIVLFVHNHETGEVHF